MKLSISSNGLTGSRKLGDRRRLAPRRGFGCDTAASRLAEYVKRQVPPHKSIIILDSTSTLLDRKRSPEAHETFDCQLTNSAYSLKFKLRSAACHEPAGVARSAVNDE